MKKIIIAPDSFKGTLSSSEVCKIISGVLKRRYPDCNIAELPIADGGEGTCEAYLHIFGGKKVKTIVKSPLGNKIEAFYALLSNNTAVIETAAASGINIEKSNNALLASSYGTGQLILHAIEGGAKNIIIGLGGSATTDGGAGIISALGGRFLDRNGNVLENGGVFLEKLSKIDLTELKKQINGINFTALCDVQNPLFGKNGAAYIYSPQKGASENDVKILDNALKKLAAVSQKSLGVDYSMFPGSGAAGGIGFAVLAFLNGRLQSGIDCILDAAEFEKKLQLADLVITGEGKMDNQSLMGKAPFGVAKRCKGVRVIAVVGVLEARLSDVQKAGISEVIETNPEHLLFEQIRSCAKVSLEKAAEKIELCSKN